MSLGNCRQFEYPRIKVRAGRELKGEAERRKVDTKENSTYTWGKPLVPQRDFC